MSYEHNLLVNFLSKYSTDIQHSKISKSYYFYFKKLSIRYSDHKTEFLENNRIEIIRKSKQVLILLPDEIEYKTYNEKTGMYFIRRLILQDINTKEPELKPLKKKKIRQNENKEGEKIKDFLKTLKNYSIKDFKDFNE